MKVAVGCRELGKISQEEVLDFLIKITNGNKQATKRNRYSTLSSFCNFTTKTRSDKQVPFGADPDFIQFPNKFIIKPGTSRLRFEEGVVPFSDSNRTTRNLLTGDINYTKRSIKDKIKLFRCS